MQSAFRLTLSLLAAAALLVSFTTTAVRADDATAKGTITGTVTKDGQPVANTTVRLMKSKGDATTQPAEGGAKPAKVAPVTTAKTNDKGEFTMKDVAAGSYNVVVGNKSTGRGTEKVEVKAGETATVTVTIAAAK